MNLSLSCRHILLLFVFLGALVLVPHKTAFAGDISTAGYMNVEFSILPQSGVSQDLFFKSDGTKFYTLDFYNPSVYEYSLSSAWDLSTASYSSVSTTTANQFSKPRSVFFKSDGTKAYFVSSDTDTVYQYSLSPAWDISTLSYDSVSFSVSGQDTAPNDLEFGDSGSKMYVMGFISDTVFQYTLTTPWDLSTASYTLSYSVTTQASSPINLSLSSDGTKMRVASGTKIYQYTLSTAWDVSTASYDSVNVSYSGQESVQGMYFKSDDSRFFLSSISNDKVYQWSLEPDTTDPTVSITSPSNGVATSSTVTLGASASDDFGIAGVSFYVNGVKQGGEDTSSPYSINWDSTATTTTAHSVFAVARDTSNNYATSTSIAFTTDNTAPTVSYFNPVDNATGVDADAIFEITFDETIATSTGNIVLYKTSDDSTVETIDITSSLVSASSTTALLINPSTTLDSQTEYYFLIDATAIDDSVSNSYAGITASTVWSFTTADTTNPTVSTFSPVDDATSVAIDSNLVITFDESMATSTGNITIKKISDDSTVEAFDVSTSVLVTVSGTAYTINPTSDLDYETEYYIQIATTAYDDLFGNSYAGIADTTSWSFTTVDTPVCASIANTATYNAYPTCGVATCNSGYTLSGSECVLQGGGGGIFTGLASDLPGYTKPRPQIIYQDGTIVYLDMGSQTEPLATIVKKKNTSPRTSTQPSFVGERDTKKAQRIFERNLRVGFVGDDVKELQKFLNMNGFILALRENGSPGNETNFFGPLTYNALIKFQEAYSKEILEPWNITKGTGFFGKTTRALVESNFGF